MRIGVVVRPGTDSNGVDESVAAAREAAEAGLAGVWFGQLFAEDAVGLAGIVGREVPGIEVGVSAIPVFARHPILVGSQARTSQAATHGRFRLGVALGAPGLVEPVFGVPYERPIARLREFLTALGPLLATGNVDHHGELVTAATPFPSVVAGATPTVPVLVAAMGPQALRASGELADGVLPRLAGPGVLENRIVPAVTAAAGSAGRPAPAIVPNVAAAVTADPDRTRVAVRDQQAFYEDIPSYRRVLDEEGVERAGDLALLGDERTVEAGLRRYLDAGATELIVEVVATGAEDRARTLRLLGSLGGA